MHGSCTLRNGIHFANYFYGNVGKGSRYSLCTGRNGENSSVSCSGILNSKTIDDNNNDNNDCFTKGHISDTVTWSRILINSHPAPFIYL